MDLFMIVFAKIIFVSAMMFFNIAVADHTSVLEKAWNDACKSDAGSFVVNIPAGKVLWVKPITFNGPCRTSNITFLVEGQIKAVTDPKKTNTSNGYMGWLQFVNVHGLVVRGRGSLDGQGKGWWDIHCRDHPGPGCIWLAPIMLSFNGCSDVLVSGLSFTNSPQTHVLVFGSKNVHLSYIHINSPENSPNTDGVHIAASSGISITHSNIASGDDCVSIGDQTSDVNITVMICGPGHGVSIGSLGKDGDNVKVEDIRVHEVNFTGTTNGGRIKTWQVGTGNVRRVEFADLHFSSVENPIIIDQYYCDKPNSCAPSKTGVHIDNVSYKRASGTSKTETAINLNCSNSVPCTNIVLDSINLKPAASVKSISSACNFAHGTARGSVVPRSCLSS